MTSIKSYTEALNYIFSLRKPRENYTPGIHLERLIKFLEFVGNPHLDYEVIHIGGTSGKGSVSYMTSKILIEHGLKVGTHISPHLLSINEKFQLDLNNISNEGLIEITNWLQVSVGEFTKQTGILLSYYEGIVAMVFKYFSLSKVDVAVIEVGLGGKLDATNVVNSKIAVLTNVGLDHMDLLGNTKEEILKDKVEIMKPNKEFITGVKEINLLDIIKTQAIQKNNSLSILNRDFKASLKEIKPKYSVFSFNNEDLNIVNIKIGLAGIYQVENAALAIQTSQKYLKDKFNVEILRKALDKLSFPGRMQTISEDPLIIFDGAHNESKMRALAESMNSIYPDKQIKLLLSFKKGKNLELIINELKNFKISSIIITEFEWEYYDKLESTKAEEVKRTLEQYLNNIKIEIYKDPFEAFNRTSHNIKTNEILLVTGSLYLLGSLLQKINA